MNEPNVAILTLGEDPEYTDYMLFKNLKDGFTCWFEFILEVFWELLIECW